jgi:hypothetical protein
MVAGAKEEETKVEGLPFEGCQVCAGPAILGAVATVELPGVKIKRVVIEGGGRARVTWINGGPEEHVADLN